MLTAARLRFGTPRSLWGITPILTLRTKAQADRQLGFHAASMVFVTYHIARDFDINRESESRYVRQEYPESYAIYERLILLWALLRFDVFHYFYDRGILTPEGKTVIRAEELKLLARSGKRLYTYAYGADVRTRSATMELGPFNFCIDCPEIGKFCICDDTEGARNILEISRYATAMLAMGDMLTYVPGAINTYYWPLDLSRIKYVGVPASSNRELQVVHATNHPHFKGTRYLIETVRRLKNEGLPIALTLVQNMSNEEAQRNYSQADIVAEQFIGGFHGYTALEAMASGKPVITYLRSSDLVLAPQECPLINVTPETLYETLKHFVLHPHELRALGERSRSYVEKYYSTAAFAARLGRMYLETARFPRRLERRLQERIDDLERACPRD
jgi:glycosyltransferase involved in cell wall biosynthesis